MCVAAVGTWLLALTMVAAAACGKSRLPGEPRPWEGGKSENDSHLVAILHPDRAVEEERLVEGKDGRVYYLAILSEEPGHGYWQEYGKLLASRGLLIKAIRFAHHTPSVAEGYEVTVLRREPGPGFVLYRSTFRDVDQKWSGWRDYPHPLEIEGKNLRMRLGRREQLWTDLNVFPDRDLVVATELPLRRFPGSFVREVLVKKDRVDHWYQARGTTRQMIIDHYDREFRRVGVEGVVRTTDGESIDGAKCVSLGVTRVMAEATFRAPLAFATGINGDVESLLPVLSAGAPKDSVVYRVSVWFADPAHALLYAEKSARRSK